MTIKAECLCWLPGDRELNTVRKIVFAIISFLKGRTVLPSCRINENILAVQCGYVNFFIYQKDNTLVCFDCGFGCRKINLELKKLGIEPADVSHIFLTHSDYDHYGGANAFSNADIFIAAEEINMLKRGIHRPLGLTEKSPEINKYKQLQDGQIVQAGGITIECILTSGHTWGSMSYLVDGRYLFAGDACGIRGNVIVPLKKYINMNTALQTESIARLKKIKGIEMTFVGHTGYKQGF